MRRTTFAILLFPFVFLLASGCERDKPSDAAQGDTTKKAAEQPSEVDTAEAPVPAADEASSSVGEEGATGDAQTKDAVPAGWVAVSCETPKGHLLSFAVPGAWIAVAPPTQDTLAVRAAPPNGPAAGLQVTVVAVEFVGGREELVAHVKQRLSSFATVESEEESRIGQIDGYKLTAKWPTPGGTKDTVQLGVAMGQEALGVTCKFPVGKLGSLIALCDRILATVSVNDSER